MSNDKKSSKDLKTNVARERLNNKTRQSERKEQPQPAGKTQGTQVGKKNRKMRMNRRDELKDHLQRNEERDLPSKN